MFQIAIHLFVLDLKTGKKHRSVITAVAITKNQIAFVTLSNILEKSISLNASIIPLKPIAKYAMATIISKTGINQESRPFLFFFSVSVSIYYLFFINCAYCLLSASAFSLLFTQILSNYSNRITCINWSPVTLWVITRVKQYLTSII